MRVSEYVLGRRVACERFDKTGTVTVSVVQCLPVCAAPWRMHVETKAKGRRSTMRILYRIRVIRKDPETQPL